MIGGDRFFNRALLKWHSRRFELTGWSTEEVL